MSYMGTTPLIVSYCKELNKTLKKIQKEPRQILILEIGVDRGQTSLPLMQNLIDLGIDFIWTGVDIRYDDTLHQQINLMRGVDHIDLQGSPVNSKAYYVTYNSLEFLKIDKNVYDVIMIDGDHNYDTVKEELSYLPKITHPMSLVVLDDFGGRHEGKDSWYSDRATHKELEHLSTHLSKSKNKGGVKAAVIEFLETHSGWTLSSFFHYKDPAFLTQKISWRAIKPGSGQFFKTEDGQNFSPLSSYTADCIEIIGFE